MRSAALTAILLLLCLPASSLLEASGQPEAGLTVYYTASLNGNLDGCACASSPKAGLVRRAAFLRSLQDREGALLVDLGDILEAFPDKLLAVEILETYRELGYDAVALGDQELAYGGAALSEAARRLALLSNNLSFSPGTGALSPQPLVIEREGLRIGVLSLLDPAVLQSLPEAKRQGLVLEAPAQAAGRLLEALRSERADLTVLLYHGPYVNALALAGRVAGIDLLLVGHEQRLIAARRRGGTIVASPGEQGNYLGILKLSLRAGRVSGFKNRFRQFGPNDPEDPGVRRRIEAYRDRLRLKY